MKKYRFALIGIIGVILIFGLLKLTLPIKYDNKTPKHDLNKSFSLSQIEKIRNKTDINNNIDGRTPIRYIKKAACYRSTEFGGYGIYPQESGGELYVLFNESERVYGNIFVEEFITKDEFLGCKDKTAEEILSMGGWLKIPYASSGSRYYFFLKDGIADVYFQEPTLKGNEKPYIFDVISEEEYIELSEKIPYILPIDRNTG